MRIYLKGGLGNQMFQYAYGRAKSLRRNTPLKLDLSDLLFPLTLRNKETPRSYKLGHFNIQAEVIIPTKRPFLRQMVRKIYEKFVRKERNFQNEHYFKACESIIREDFDLKEALSEKASFMYQQIATSINPVSIHVRRGDYVTDIATALHHGALPISYYKGAVEEIYRYTAEPTFVVFSDDIEWAKSNLPLPQTIIFVSDNTIQDYEELKLMSACEHHIIANSSFSWWGAWLNPKNNKTVIAPKQWFTRASFNASSIVPKEWILK